MSFCSLKKGYTQKIRVVVFVLINSVLVKFYVLGFCFRTLAVNLVSEFVLH